jgi:hypothetical protein
MRRLLATLAIAGFMVGIPSAAFADPSPNGPGQPGAPGTTCGSSNAASAPASAVTTSNNSVFNGNGQASAVYAGNPNTASLANANSANAVSQYDIACFQVSSH